MKLIISIIDQKKVEELRTLLMGKGVLGMKITDAQIFQKRNPGRKTLQKVLSEKSGPVNKISMEISVEDEHLAETVEEIAKRVRAGGKCVGEMFVVDMP